MSQTDYPTVPTELGTTVTVQTSDELQQYLPDDIDADSVIDLLETRQETRPTDRFDALLVIEPWATRDSYDIVDSRLLLAGAVSIYSEKALQCRGAFQIDVTQLNDWKYMSSLLSPVEQDYDRTFVPRSAVETIIKPEIGEDQ